MHLFKSITCTQAYKQATEGLLTASQSKLAICNLLNSTCVNKKEKTDKYIFNYKQTNSAN